jgi:hypothetical protein
MMHISVYRFNPNPLNAPLGHYRAGAGSGSAEAEDFGLREAAVIGDGHDDGIGEGCGVEGDALVIEDGRVGVEREGQDGGAEGRHGTGDEAGELQEFFGGGEAGFLCGEVLFEGGGIELAVGAEDEEAEGVVDLDEEGFATDAEFFAAGAGGVFRGAGGFVMDFAVSDVFGGEPGADLLQEHGDSMLAYGAV